MHLLRGRGHWGKATDPTANQTEIRTNERPEDRNVVLIH